LNTTAPTAIDSFDFNVLDIIPIIAFRAVEEELEQGKSRLPIIPRVGIAVISSIDSIKAASVLRALFGGIVAVIVVVIMSRSGRKRGTLLENNSNLT
jgi:hypothetical protein